MVHLQWDFWEVYQALTLVLSHISYSILQLKTQKRPDILKLVSLLELTEKTNLEEERQQHFVQMNDQDYLYP